jgi:hypothetical protein
MNPFLTAGLARLEEVYDDLLALINRVDEASLDWKPTTSDTNSTAILVKHISVSTASWLSRALDEPMARDRDAEFRFSGSRDELIGIINASRQTSRDQFARLNSVDPGAIRHYERITKPEQSEFTVAWCIEHALVHTAEHWGEIQLIQQLFAAR